MSSNRLMYDTCATQQRIEDSVGELKYVMNMAKHEHPQRCGGKVPPRYVIVDAESELKGLTRKSSKCAQNGYDPKCKKSSTCTSTFDKSMPVVMAPEVCRIVETNLPKFNHPGYVLKPCN